MHGYTVESVAPKSNSVIQCQPWRNNLWGEEIDLGSKLTPGTGQR